MASYSHDVVGYKDWDDIEHKGIPESPDVESVLVHAWNNEHPSDQHHFWVHNPAQWDSWDDMLDWIENAMDNYGMGGE